MGNRFYFSKQIFVSLIPVLVSFVFSAAKAQSIEECRFWSITTTTKEFRNSQNSICGATGFVDSVEGLKIGVRQFTQLIEDHTYADGKVEHKDTGVLGMNWCGLPEDEGACYGPIENEKIRVICRPISCFYYGAVSNVPFTKKISEVPKTNWGPVDLVREKKWTFEGPNVQYPMISSSYVSKYFLQWGEVSTVPEPKYCSIVSSCSSIADGDRCNHTLSSWPTEGANENKGVGCIWKVDKCSVSDAMSPTLPALKAELKELIDGSLVCVANLTGARLDQLTFDGKTYGGYINSIPEPNRLTCDSVIPPQVFIPPSIEIKSFGSAPLEQQYYDKKSYSTSPSGGAIVSPANYSHPAISQWQYSAVVPQEAVTDTILKNYGGGFSCGTALGRLSSGASLTYACDGSCPNKFIGMLKGYQKASTGTFFKIKSANEMLGICETCSGWNWNSILTEDVAAKVSFGQTTPVNSPFVVPLLQEENKPQEYLDNVFFGTKNILSCLEKSSEQATLRGGADITDLRMRSPGTVRKAFPTANERKLGVVEWSYTLNQITDNRKIYTDERTHANAAMNQIVAAAAKAGSGQMLSSEMRSPDPDPIQNAINAVPSAINLASKILSAHNHHLAYSALRRQLVTGEDQAILRARRYLRTGSVLKSETEPYTPALTALEQIFQDLCVSEHLKICVKFEDLYSNVQEMMDIDTWFINSSIEKYPFLKKANSPSLFAGLPGRFPNNNEIFAVIRQDMWDHFTSIKTERAKDLEDLTLLELYLKCPNKEVEEKIGDRFNDIVAKMRERNAVPIQELREDLNKKMLLATTVEEKASLEKSFKVNVEWELAYETIRARRGIMREIHLSDSIRSTLHQGIWTTILSGGLSAAASSVPHLLKLTKTYKLIKETKDIAEASAKGKQLSRLGLALYLGIEGAQFGLAAQSIPAAVETCSEIFFGIGPKPNASSFDSYFICATNAVDALLTSASFGLSSWAAARNLNKLVPDIEMNRIVAIKSLPKNTIAEEVSLAKAVMNFVNPGSKNAVDQRIRRTMDNLMGRILPTYRLGVDGIISKIVEGDALFFVQNQQEINRRFQEYRGLLVQGGIEFVEKSSGYMTSAGTIIFPYFEIAASDFSKLNTLAKKIAFSTGKPMIISDELIRGEIAGIIAGLKGGEKGYLFPGSTAIAFQQFDAVLYHEYVHAAFDAFTGKGISHGYNGIFAATGVDLSSVPNMRGYQKHVAVEEVIAFAKGLIFQIREFKRFDFSKYEISVVTGALANFKTGIIQSIDHAFDMALHVGEVSKWAKSNLGTLKDLEIVARETPHLWPSSGPPTAYLTLNWEWAPGESKMMLIELVGKEYYDIAKKFNHGPTVCSAADKAILVSAFENQIANWIETSTEVMRFLSEAKTSLLNTDWKAGVASIDNLNAWLNKRIADKLIVLPPSPPATP